MKGERKIEERKKGSLVVHEGCSVLMEIYVIICLFSEKNASFFEKVWKRAETHQKQMTRDLLVELSKYIIKILKI